MSGNQYRRHQPSAIVALTLLMVYLPGCFGGLNIRAENEDEDEITESHCEPATGPGTDVASTAGGPHLYWASSESNLIERAAADLSRFSARARDVASIIGVRNLLSELHYLKKIWREG